MMPFEPGETGPNVEELGQIGKFIANIDSSTLALKDALSNPINLASISLAATEHTLHISRLFDHVLSQEDEYPLDDAIDIMSGIFKHDEETFIDFFRTGCGEVGGYMFDYKFDQEHETAITIRDIVDHFDEHHGGREGCVETFMAEYIENLQSDINTFINYHSMTERDSLSAILKHELKERLLQATTTAVGVIIGSLVVKALWRKGGK